MLCPQGPWCPQKCVWKILETFCVFYMQCLCLHPCGHTPKPWNSDVVTSKWPTPWGNFVCLFFSSVHDHSNSHCFMKVLDGCLKETLYDWPSQSEPEKPLVQTRVSYAEKEQVVYINGTGNSTSGFLPTSLDRRKYTNRRAGVQRDGWMDVKIL